MFGLFRKKQTPSGKTIEFSIEGMHCASCAMNIDGKLEETEGVVSSRTSYARAKTSVLYDPERTDERKIRHVIRDTGYSAR